MREREWLLKSIIIKKRNIVISEMKVGCNLVSFFLIEGRKVG
jgi:hypothetical protein